jgi:hypothetical protein
VKTLTPDQSRTRKPDAVSTAVPQTWEDFNRLYPIYEALTRQLDLIGGPYPSGPKIGGWSDKKSRERDLNWLDQVDRQVQAVNLRHFLVTPAVAREDGLRLFLQHHLYRAERLPADRDKIDLLLVQYFVFCAPPEMIAGRIEPADVAKVLEPVLGVVDTASTHGCEPLDRILEAAQKCRSLRDMMEQGLLEQGKLVKAGVGDLFYEAAALVSICRFNFLLRRTFIQWLHADLRAIGAAITLLEKRGVKVVDCRRAGLSSKEQIPKLRQFHEHWKPPFQNDYSQDAAFQPYEQLMCLREDLEDALGATGPSAAFASTPLENKETGQDIRDNAEPPRAGRSSEGVTSAKPAPVDPTSGDSLSPEETLKLSRAFLAEAAQSRSGQPLGPGETAKLSRAFIAEATQAHPGNPISPTETARLSRAFLAEAAQSREPSLPNIGVADVESLEEKIWEQLIETPPVRGRSMTTVTVENTRILLSAWEVAAFISDSGQDSKELRRLIVARALISTSIERRKRLMDFKLLHQAVAHARAEIPRFQERVDQLKRTQKTDGAVNLGISLKRLLCLVEEAEQLQKGNEQKQEK